MLIGRAGTKSLLEMEPPLEINIVCPHEMSKINARKLCATRGRRGEQQYGHDVTDVRRVSDAGYLQCGITPHTFKLDAFLHSK